MLIVAVNVTLWFAMDGLTVDTSVVLVLAWVTFCVTAVALLAAKLSSPL